MEIDCWNNLVQLRITPAQVKSGPPDVFRQENDFKSSKIPHNPSQKDFLDTDNFFVVAKRHFKKNRECLSVDSCFHDDVLCRFYDHYNLWSLWSMITTIYDHYDDTDLAVGRSVKSLRFLASFSAY